jgi:glucose-6-phosphate dehydrogenase assembly protein OpcA
MWARAPRLFDRTALTDLHWTALTRWRAALAHLVDLPHVRQGLASLNRLEIAASDRAAARLFAGWLRSSLQGIATLDVRIDEAPGRAHTPLARVRLSGGGPGLTLQVREDRTCLEAAVDGANGARMVPLGNGSLAARFVDEIGVRVRDAAFERALVAAMEIGA